MNANDSTARARARISRTGVAAVLAILAAAQPAVARGPRCSDATLKGQYSFYREGTTPTGPLSGIGILLFDGKGEMMGMQDTAVNGVLSLDAPVPPNPYSVDADCTGKFLMPNGSEVARVVVVDGGKAFYFLSMRPGNSVRGEARRTDGD